MVLKSPSSLARLFCRHIGVQLSTPLLLEPCMRVSEVGPHNLLSLGTLLHVRSRTQLSTRSKKQATSPFLIKPKMIDIPWILSTQEQCTHGTTHRHTRNNEHSEQARAPHKIGPRDVPRCGALSLIHKPLKEPIQYEAKWDRGECSG